MHYTAMIKLDGVWRNLLVITSDIPIDYIGITDLSFDFSLDGKTTTITYHTEGLYKTYVKAEKTIYWFFYSNQTTTINGESEEMADLRQANNVLMGVET